MDVRVHRSSEVACKLRARLLPGVACGNELHSLVLQERWKHQGECTTEAGDTEANGACRSHRSSTSSADLARETQIMIRVPISSGISTMSRWSASPEIKPVRQVPQVPLSHEDA